MNSMDEIGRFPLDIALKLCNFDMADALCDCGADVNAMDGDGKCFVSKAVEKGKLLNIILSIPIRR